MKLIKPSYQILEQGNTLNDIYKHIELCGRTCYKSEDKITDDSAKPFVDRIIASKHYAMLEHGTVYLFYFECASNFKENLFYFYKYNPYSKVEECIDDDFAGKYAKRFMEVEKIDRIGLYHLFFITTNLRVLVENNRLEDLKYICEPNEYHEKRYTVRFTSDIHFYKDCTRHRAMSWAIESTRFCNYMKDKFSASVTFAEPCWLKEEEREEFVKDCETLESIYFKWLNNGWKPQQAAYFLCQGTKAEAIMTAFEEDYEHFFELRAIGTTGDPHPSVKELALPLMKDFINKGYVSHEFVERNMNINEE